MERVRGKSKVKGNRITPRLTDAALQVEAGETIVEAAAREVREECGYIVRTEDLGKCVRCDGQCGVDEF